MQIREASTGNLRTTLAHASGVHVVAFDPGGARLVSGGEDGIEIWSTENWVRVDTVSVPDGAWHLTFDPKGNTVLIATGTGSIRAFDLVSEVLSTIVPPPREAFSVTHCIAHSPDGRFFAVGEAYSNLVRLYHAASGTAFATLKGHRDHVSCVAISPDSRLIVSGARNMLVWDSETGEQLAMTGGGGLHSLAFSPDGTRIVTGTEDGLLRFWDTETRSLLCTLRGHDGVVTALAFSPDGKRIVSGSLAAGTRVWDTELSSARKMWHADALRRGAAPVNERSFSPDGTWIASAAGSAVHIRDAATEEVIDILGQPHVVECLAFNPDGNLIASGLGDNTIRSGT